MLFCEAHIFQEKMQAIVFKPVYFLVKLSKLFCTCFLSVVIKQVQYYLFSLILHQEIIFILI